MNVLPEDIDTPAHPFVECTEPYLFEVEPHCAAHCGRTKDDQVHVMPPCGAFGKCGAAFDDPRHDFPPKNPPPGPPSPPSEQRHRYLHPDDVPQHHVFRCERCGCGANPMKQCLTPRQARIRSTAVDGNLASAVSNWDEAHGTRETE